MIPLQKIKFKVDFKVKAFEVTLEVDKKIKFKVGFKVKAFEVTLEVDAYILL